MNESKNPKPPAMIAKKKLFLSLICLGIVFLLVYGYRYSINNQEDLDRKAIEKTLKQYERIRTTILSDDFHGELIKIIKARKECFSSQVSYDERSVTCKRAYVNDIVRLARDKIKSAPLRGLFIRGIRECPIAGSLCNGEEGTQELECIEMEARCIEYFLDEYWRGGSFLNGNTYTYKKNKKN